MNYDMIIASMNQAIDTFSNGAVYTVRRKGSVTVVNGEDVITPATEFTVSGAVASIDPRMVDGTTVKSGDRKMLIKAAGFTLQQADTFLLDDGSWYVVNPQPVQPGGDVIAWHPILRKGAA